LADVWTVEVSPNSVEVYFDPGRVEDGLVRAAGLSPSLRPSRVGSHDFTGSLCVTVRSAQWFVAVCGGDLAWGGS
jgi:hypothetical protein